MTLSMESRPISSMILTPCPYDPINGEQAHLFPAAVDGRVNLKLRDLGRVPYVSYGVKYIDLVSLELATVSHLKFWHGAPLFQNGLQATPGFEMWFGPSTLGAAFGAGAKTRLESREKDVYAALCLQANMICWQSVSCFGCPYKHMAIKLIIIYAWRVSAGRKHILAAHLLQTR